jgi:hypothetical protein
MSAATCRSNCSTDTSAQTGNPGLANTGGGGGGSGNATNSSPAGKGGSGVVIVRFTLILNATATISMASGQVIYRTPKTLSVVSSVAGKVDFFANGKAIPACRNVVANAGIHIPLNVHILLPYMAQSRSEPYSSQVMLDLLERPHH